jgi:hypothetical protein
MSQHHAQHLAPEPKDGDFVAYLAQIEQRQLKAMREGHPPSPAPVAPPPLPSVTARPHKQDEASTPYTPMNKHQAEAIVDVLKNQAKAKVGASANEFVGGLVIGFVALVFFLSGLSGGHMVPMLIGIGLAWLAFTRLRKAFAGDGADLARRLRRRSGNMS